MPVTPRRPAARPSPLPLVAVALAAGIVGSAATLGLQRTFLPPAAAPAAVPAVPLAGDPRAGASTAPRVQAPVPRPAPTNEPADAALATLRADVDAAATERSRIDASLATLEREVGELTDAVGARNLPGAQADAGSEAGGPAAGDAVAEVAPATREERALANLVAAGLDPASAEGLRRRQDEFQLARLDLVDQAAREGWDDSDEFEERLDALEQTRPDLRGELGDEGYDRFLSESGTPNRVGIVEVIPGSQAASAGLQPGDLVVGYADGRVFTPDDLQEATRGGTRGEPVNLLVERGEQTVTVNVQRGPLGVTLERESREP